MTYEEARIIIDELEEAIKDVEAVRAKLMSDVWIPEAQMLTNAIVNLDFVKLKLLRCN